MTDFVRFVNTASAGGDGTTNNETGTTAAYVSASAAFAGEDGVDFVTGGPHSLTFKCTTGSGTAVDSTVARLLDANWANPPTGGLTVESNTADRPGDTDPNYNVSIYRVEAASGYNGVISTDLSETVTFDGLQATSTSGNASAAFRMKQPTGVTAKVINCIGKHTAGLNTDGVICGIQGSTVIVSNSVFFDFARYGINNSVFHSTGGISFTNNTVENCTTGGIRTQSGNAGQFDLFNNLCQGNGTDYLIASAADNQDNNISLDTSSPQTAHQSITVTFDSADDYQTSDADVVGLGTDLSSTGLHQFSTDRLGVSRGASWDIGAYQDVAAPGGRGIMNPLFGPNPLRGPLG